MLPHDDEVESRARALFRSACENADSYHTLRLGLARRKALNAGASRFARWMWGPLAGGAGACCALVIGVLWLHPFATPRVVPDTTPPQPVLATAGSDIDDTVGIGSSQMEMVQDLDFYRWLASQQDTPAPSGRSAR